MRRRLALLAALSLTACPSRTPRPPEHLLLGRTAEGGMPRAGALSTGGETRPALLASASFRVRLPPRALLTFGMGLAWANEAEAPGWYHLAVRAGEATVLERRLNPRAARGFRDLSVPLSGPGETVLSFQIRLTDRDGRDVPHPPALLLGVADPVVHDQGAYGRSPGVLLVSIDTLRRDHVGAHGYPRPTTPRLDALAADGLLAEDAVSTSSWTLPAHLSLLTSVDPGAHGGVDMRHRFAGRVPTLPQALRRAGWATQAVTSHLYVSSVYGLDAGFDRLDFVQDRRAPDVAARAIDLLDRYGDRPFFIFLHFYDPHWHYDPPESTRRLLVRPYSGTLTGNLKDFQHRTRANTTEADRRHLLDLYDGEIRHVDDELGRVLDHLDERGLRGSTLAVVTSDHGEEFLEHGSWEHQKTLYEEVVRIPLVVAGPRVTARRERAQVSLLDVAPTILDWAGLPPLPGAQGLSLLRPLAAREAFGETDHTADRTFKLFWRDGAGRGKAILSLRRSDGALAAEEWYDLAADPVEARSRPPADPAADALRRRALERWHRARGRGQGAPAVELGPEQRERLRALGYVGS